MKPTLLRTLACVSALLACVSRVQAAEAWVGYRDAYHALARFERWQGPRNLLMLHLRADGLRGASLSGAPLAVDAAGRIDLPLARQPYDDNAPIALDGARHAAPALSIRPAADGRYDAAMLRSACAQAEAWSRHVRAARTSCAGVRFIATAGSSPATHAVRLADLPDGAVFAPGAVAIVPVME